MGDLAFDLGPGGPVGGQPAGIGAARPALGRVLLVRADGDHAALLRRGATRGQRAGGSQTVCAYGINVGPGANDQLRCLPITISGDPFGTLDAITRVPGGVRLQGWAIDPDAGHGITVEFYSGNNDMGGTVANGHHADLASLYPDYGGYHAYDVTLAIGAGQQTVCAYGINVGQGGNTQLVCPEREGEFDVGECSEAMLLG